MQIGKRKERKNVFSRKETAGPIFFSRITEPAHGRWVQTQVPGNFDNTAKFFNYRGCWLQMHHIRS